jgi:hypothetical protein
MLVLAAACMLVSGSALILGMAALSALGAEAFRRLGDRVVVALWLGIVIECTLLLAVVVFAPLSAPVGGGVIAVAVGIAATRPLARRQIIELRSTLSSTLLIAIMVLVLAVAAVAASPVTYYDTGGYHFGIIRWLSRFGATPGVALLHRRFALTSSWLALAAPFNAGPLEARMSTLPGALALLLAFLHLAVAGARLLRRRAQPSDIFVIVAYLLVLPVVCRSQIMISPSPDLPVTILVVTIAWVVLLLGAARAASSGADAVPWILGVGAVAMKLNAFPLLLAAGVYSLVRTRRLTGALALGLSPLVPLTAVGAISSGCPLYPAQVCLDVPWALPAELIDTLATTIRERARWQGDPPADAGAWNWIAPWVRTNLEGTALLAYTALSVGLLWRRRSIWIDGTPWVLGLGVLGTAFTMYAAPDLRFGLGYFSIVPALFVAVLSTQTAPSPQGMWCFLAATLYVLVGRLKVVYPFLLPALLAFRQKATPRVAAPPVSRVLPAVLLAISVCAVPMQVDVNHRLRQRLLGAAQPSVLAFPLALPPPLRVPQEQDLARRRIGDVNLVVPKLEQCWAAELPCTTALAVDSIRLRRPEIGIAGGFLPGAAP